MKVQREKNRERLRLFMIAAMVVGVSGIAMFVATPQVSAFLEPALAIDGRGGCISYQSYPAQLSCSMVAAVSSQGIILST
jgi:hypothetical protein